MTMLLLALIVVYFAGLGTVAIQAGWAHLAAGQRLAGGVDLAFALVLHGLAVTLVRSTL